MFSYSCEKAFPSRVVLRPVAFIPGPVLPEFTPAYLSFFYL